MAGKLDSYSLPPAVRRIAATFRMTGWISFWAQLVLGIISGIVTIFASRSLQTSNNPGAGFGFFFAVLGVLFLFLGAFWGFRYTRLARRLQTADARSRPKPADVIQALRLGLIINLVGMLLTLLGAQAIVGSLLAKSLAQPQGGAIYELGRTSQYIQSLDIFIVQANTNTVLAHFVGIVASLWLVRCMSRQ